MNQIREITDTAAQWLPITRQIAYRNGEISDLDMLVNEHRRAGRVMRKLLKEPHRVEVTSQAVAWYGRVTKALAIVRAGQTS